MPSIVETIFTAVDNASPEIERVSSAMKSTGLSSEQLAGQLEGMAAKAGLTSEQMLTMMRSSELLSEKENTLLMVQTNLKNKMGELTTAVSEGKMSAEEAGIAFRDYKEEQMALAQESGVLQERTAGVKLSMTDLWSAVDLVRQGIEMLRQGYEQTIAKTVKYAETVEKLSNISGMAAEQASKLILFGQRYGVTIDNLAMANRKLAGEGLTMTIESLAKLSDRYLGLANDAAKAKFLTDNFGRSGYQLAEIMQLGSKAILENASALNNHMVLTEQNIKDAQQLTIAQENLTQAWNGVSTELSMYIIPYLTDYLKILTIDILATSQFIDLLSGKVDISQFGKNIGDIVNKNMPDILAKIVTGNPEAIGSRFAAGKPADMSGMQDAMAAIGTTATATTATTKTALSQQTNLQSAFNTNSINMAQSHYNNLATITANGYAHARSSQQKSFDQMLQDYLANNKKATSYLGYSMKVADQTAQFNKQVMEQSQAMMKALGMFGPRTAHASGGSFIVPAGYGNEGFDMGGIHTASAGERVTITPAGQGGAVTIGTMNIGDTSQYGRADMEAMIEKAFNNALAAR